MVDAADTGNVLFNKFNLALGRAGKMMLSSSVAQFSALIVSFFLRFLVIKPKDFYNE